MSYRVHIIIKGQIDSKKLWEQIQCFPVNLLDAADSVWIYGYVEHKDLQQLINRCSKYGLIDASIQS